MLAQNFRANVRRERMRLKWSQSELGRRLGMPSSTVSNMENRDQNPTVETIERVALVLGVDPVSLLLAPVPHTPAEEFSDSR